MADKILIVWNEIPERTTFYAVDSDSVAAELALKSAGLYINGDDVKEGDPLDRLNDLLPEIKSFDTNQVAEGPFSKVVVCGLIM